MNEYKKDLVTRLVKVTVKINKNIGIVLTKSAVFEIAKADSFSLTNCPRNFTATLEKIFLLMTTLFIDVRLLFYIEFPAGIYSKAYKSCSINASKSI